MAYTSSSSSSSSITVWEYFGASLITGVTVVIMQGIFESIFLNFGGESMLLRLILNLLVSAGSGFVAIMLVAATGLLG